MGKKLTKKLLVFLTLMCMIIGMNVSISAETGSTGNTKAISAAGKSGGRNASGMA